MKIKLLLGYDPDLPRGLVGEALGYEITSNSVVLKCVFYGREGVHRIDIRDALSLTAV